GPGIPTSAVAVPATAPAPRSRQRVLSKATGSRPPFHRDPAISAAQASSVIQSLRGLVYPGAAAWRRGIVAEGKGALDRFDAVAGTEAGDEGVGEGGILEIEGDCIVEDADEPGGRSPPPIDATSFVEPGMHDPDLPAQPLGRYGDPHPYRKPPFGLLPRLHRCSRHTHLRVHASFRN